MIHQNALALQNKMMPAMPTQIPPQIPGLATQPPTSTGNASAWTQLGLPGPLKRPPAAGAKASTRSMARKDLHDFASRCPPHPGHGVI